MERKIKKDKKKFDVLNFSLYLLFFIVGILVGYQLGFENGMHEVFIGLGEVLQGSDIDVNLNETKLVDGFKEAIEPLFHTFAEEINKTR